MDELTISSHVGLLGLSAARRACRVTGRVLTVTVADAAVSDDRSDPHLVTADRCKGTEQVVGTGDLDVGCLVGAANPAWRPVTASTSRACSCSAHSCSPGPATAVGEGTGQRFPGTFAPSSRTSSSPGGPIKMDARSPLRLRERTLVIPERDPRHPQVEPGVHRAELRGSASSRDRSRCGSNRPPDTRHRAKARFVDVSRSGGLRSFDDAGGADPRWAWLRPVLASGPGQS